MEKILVGVDESATAEAAAREAAELAKLTGAELHVVSAMKRSSTQVVHGGGEQWTISDVDRASSKLQAFAARLNAGRKVTCAVLDGEPAKAIVAEAERVGADVIVIGNKRVSGAGRVLGAIAIDIVRHAPCSVYIAKTN